MGGRGRAEPATRCALVLGRAERPRAATGSRRPRPNPPTDVRPCTSPRGDSPPRAGTPPVLSVAPARRGQRRQPGAHRHTGGASSPPPPAIWHTRLRVWPFETGLVSDPAAEVSDAVVRGRGVAQRHRLPSRRPPGEGRPTGGRARRAPRRARCRRRPGRLFAPPNALAQRAVVEGEEGWVLTVE